MPIYEYRCGECSHQFERLVRAQGTETRCPRCTSDLMVEKEDEWTDDQGETHTYLFCCCCEHEWEAHNE